MVEEVWWGRWVGPRVPFVLLLVAEEHPDHAFSKLVRDPLQTLPRWVGPGMDVLSMVRPFDQLLLDSPAESLGRKGTLGERDCQATAEPLGRKGTLAQVQATYKWNKAVLV